jgi:protein-tyrosine phosphatase
MFNFFKKKDSLIEPGAFPFSTDIHSHILPGIDDGSPDIETSLVLIQQLQDLGIKKAIATPHIIGDLYRNNASTIENALQKITTACAAAGMDISIAAAAEYMLDDYFMDLLHNKTPLLTLHNNIILTEFPYSSAPPGTVQMFESIIANGYVPILAHPERYHYFQNNFDEFFRLVETGYKLQVNLLSLTGYYGKPSEKAGKFIIKNNLANWVGTDLHHIGHAAALADKKNRRIIQNLLQHKAYNNFNQPFN